VNQLVPITSAALPTLVAAAGERASIRFVEFFAANIRNPHTRRAYARAADEFLAWCASAGVPSIGAVQPVHVATWIEAGSRELAAPSVKQRLAAIRHLFDWLVTGQVGLDPTVVSPGAIWGAVRAWTAQAAFTSPTLDRV
jgi:site-specific recombinase XerC